MTKNKHYVTITELEMDNVFQPTKGWVKCYTEFHNEIVYTKNLKVKNWIQIKVYSSLRKDSRVSASVGKDSIKVCAINIQTNKGILKTKRIHRTLGWETRLIKRVTEVWEDLK